MRRSSMAAAGPRDVREVAVALLARRDLASAELAARLASRGYAPGDIELVVAVLREERLLDDARYAHAQVLSRTGRGQGPLRIREHLLGAGVPAPQIEAALAAGPDWASLAEQARRRRFGEERPSAAAEVARQARFLQGRGFLPDHIRKATGAELDSD